MKRLILIIVSLFVVSFAKAQIAIDTLSTEALNNLLIEQVERLAEDGDEDADYEDLLENYIFLSENPVNLNSEETMRLVELHLLSVFQYEELQKYRRFYRRADRGYHPTRGMHRERPKQGQNHAQQDGPLRQASTRGAL